MEKSLVRMTIKSQAKSNSEKARKGLLEDGVYSERKLPCIVKACGKIKIEQKNGEIIEFDEDAVELGRKNFDALKAKYPEGESRIDDVSGGGGIKK